MSEKKRVLILCMGNSGWRKDSCATTPATASRWSASISASRVRPRAGEAMREAGVEISGHRSKSADELTGREFDYIITVCDNDREPCPFFPKHAERIHHSFEDSPAPGAADRDTTLEIFRRVRDEIREWLKDKFIPQASAPANFYQQRPSLTELPNSDALCLSRSRNK